MSMAVALSPVSPLMSADLTPAPVIPTTTPAPTLPTARRGLFAASHLAIQSLLLNAVSVPVMGYIVRRLGDVAFGHWSTATSLLASAAVLANLGLRGAFVRRVAREPETARAAVAEQLTLRLLLSLVAGGMAVAVACVLPYPPVVRACVAVAAAGLLFTTVNSTLADLLQGLHKISVYAGTNFLAGIALTAVSLVAVFWGAGPVGLSVAYLAGPIVGAGLLVMYVRRHLRLAGEPARRSEGRAGSPAKRDTLFLPRRFARLLIDSRFFAAQQLVNTLSLNIESLMLPLLVGAGEFGLFSAGLLLASRLVVIPDGLGSAFYPLIAARHVVDPDRLSRELRGYLLLALAVCVPVAVSISIIAKPIALLLFPHHAAVCATVIRITIWSIPMLGIENLMGYALNAAGRDAAAAKQNLLWAGLNLAVAVPLVLRFGVIGACVSFVLRTALKIACIAPLFVATFWPEPTAGARS